MAKVRKDSKGRVLHKGETYRSEDGLYRFTYSDAYGKRTSVYSKDLKQLREKEKNERIGLCIRPENIRKHQP